MTILGTTGDDSLTGTSGNDTFNVSQGGNDTVSGLDGNDVVNFGATFTAADTVNGGTGSDTVILAGDYSAQLNLGATTLTGVEVIKLTAGNSYDLAMNDANVAAGQTLAINGSLLGAGDTLTFGGGAETNGFYRVEGGAGDDTISMGAELKSKDTIDGGAGNDTLFVGGGDYSLAFAAATIHNIDDFVMFGGHDYHFVTNDTTVAAGATMQVDANSLGAGDTLIFNGVHETDGNFNFISGVGEMELTGGAGDDVFFMGAHLTAADRINGGAGSDVVYLGGANYTLSMQKPTLQSVENLKLLAGFNYNLTLGGGIATDVTMTVDATAVGLGNSLAFNALKETAGSVNVFIGAGAVNIVGGQQGDAFDASPSGQATFTAADRINGEAGYDHFYLDGDYTGAHALALTNTTVLNVEEFDFDAGHSYNVTLAAKTIAASTTLKVDASQLGATDNLTFNAAAEAVTTAVNILAGAGSDTLTGGAGNDTFRFAGTLDGTDTIVGGGGSDVVMLTSAAPGNIVLGATTLTGVGEINIVNGVSNITENDGNVAAGHTLTVLVANQSGALNATFDGSAETDGSFAFLAATGTNTFTGGAQNDTYSTSAFNGGVDQFSGGGGDDTFHLHHNFWGTGTFDGGAGNDTLEVDVSAMLLIFTAASLTSVENLVVTQNSQITMADGNVAAGATLNVTVTNGAYLIFHGEAETNGHFNITTTTDINEFFGGAQSDSFTFGGGNEAVIGGGGADTIDFGTGFGQFRDDQAFYNAASDSTGIHYDTIKNFDFQSDSINTYAAAGNHVINQRDPAVTSGRLGGATFDTDMANAITAAHLAAYDEVLFTPTTGNLAGHLFLIVDTNGVAGYQSGGDVVIDITGAQHVPGI